MDFLIFYKITKHFVEISHLLIEVVFERILERGGGKWLRLICGRSFNTILFRR